MKNYSKVANQVWSELNALEFTDTEKLLYVYLLTSTHTNLIGCFSLPYNYMAADLNWTPRKVKETMKNSIFKNKDNILYDEKCQFVYLPDILRLSPIENPNQAKAALGFYQNINKKYEFMPLITQDLLRFSKFFTLSSGVLILDSNEKRTTSFLLASDWNMPENWLEEATSLLRAKDAFCKVDIDQLIKRCKIKFIEYYQSHNCASSPKEAWTKWIQREKAPEQYKTTKTATPKDYTKGKSIAFKATKEN